MSFVGRQIGDKKFTFHKNKFWEVQLITSCRKLKACGTPALAACFCCFFHKNCSPPGAESLHPNADKLLYYGYYEAKKSIVSHFRQILTTTWSLFISYKSNFIFKIQAEKRFYDSFLAVHI